MPSPYSHTCNITEGKTERIKAIHILTPQTATSHKRNLPLPVTPVSSGYVNPVVTACQLGSRFGIARAFIVANAELYSGCFNPHYAPKIPTTPWLMISAAEGTQET